MKPFFALLPVILVVVIIVGCVKETNLQQQTEPLPEEAAAEETAVIKPTLATEEPVLIKILYLPASVREDKNVTVRWKVESDKETGHTAVHYDKVSHLYDPTSGKNIFSAGVSAKNSGYPYLTPDFAASTFTLPQEFISHFSVPSGAEKVYLRAHAVVGGKNYWTEEQSIKIEKLGCATNTPPCTVNYNCINNECVLKPGCAYDNPPCESGYQCENNNCTKIRSGGGGY